MRIEKKITVFIWRTFYAVGLIILPAGQAAVSPY